MFGRLSMVQPDPRAKQLYEYMSREFNALVSAYEETIEDLENVVRLSERLNDEALRKMFSVYTKKFILNLDPNKFPTPKEIEPYRWRFVERDIRSSVERCKKQMNIMRTNLHNKQELGKASAKIVALISPLVKDVLLIWYKMRESIEMYKGTEISRMGILFESAVKNVLEVSKRTENMMRISWKMVELTEP